MKHTQAAMLRRLWHSVYARAILALIALIIGPNSTLLRLMQFMPVTHAIY